MLDFAMIYKLTQETGYGRSLAKTNCLDMSGGQILGLQDRQTLTLEAKDFAYQPPRGREDLRLQYATTIHDDAAISEKTIVTVGAKQALFLALAYYSARVNQVFLPSPGWMPYTTLLRAFGLDILPYDPRCLTALTNELSVRRNSLVVINYPHNPTGLISAEDDLQRLIEVIVTSESFLVSDEVYRALDRRSATAAQYLGIGRVAVVDSVSKWAGAAGCRVGFLCGDEVLLDHAISVIGNSTSGTSSFGQAWASEALRENETIDRAARAASASLASLEAAVTGSGYRVAAKGGLYLWVLGGPEYEVNGHRLIGAPGEAFGARGYTRLCPLSCPNPWNTLFNNES